MKRRVNLRLVLARVLLPVARTRGLAALAALTARAFGTSAPALAGLPWERRLQRYAELTARSAAEALAGEREAAVTARLHDEGLSFGQWLRRLLDVRTLDEAMRAARLLYRSLRIDLAADAGAEITVHSCFFSAYYSPGTCRLISGLDAGVLAGLAGGGSLEFAQRLTEGHDRCLARFRPSEGIPCARP